MLYQPVIETATGSIAGFEALCRWTDGGGKAIEPREFVPIADETGLILPLGRFVLDEACRQLATWRAHPRGKHSRSRSTSRAASSPIPASSSW